jgi:hypothetical protein
MFPWSDKITISVLRFSNNKNPKSPYFNLYAHTHLSTREINTTHSTWLELMALMFLDLLVDGNISASFLALSVGGTYPLHLYKKNDVTYEPPKIILITFCEIKNQAFPRNLLIYQKHPLPIPRFPIN